MRRSAHIWGLWLLLAGCHTPLHTQLPAPLLALPAPGPAAEHYDTQLPAGPGIVGGDEFALRNAVEIAAREHNLEITPDPRLARLAAWSAEHTTPDGRLPAEQAIDAAARHLGLVEPTPHFIGLTTNASVGMQDHLLAETRQAFSDHEYSHYGGCVTQLGAGQRLYVIALAWRWLSLAPVAREVQLGSEVAHGFSSPELAVTLPDGQVVRGAPQPTGHFALRVPTRLPGVYQVELLAQGKLGIEVVANFPIYVGVPAPVDVAAPPNASGRNLVATGADDVHISLDLLNHERTLAGLHPVVLDAALSGIAKAHDLDMLEHGFVGHTSPTTGTTLDRVTRASLRSSLVLENIGRDSSVQAVHAGLMNSPGHRGNILHPQATNVGIAVVTHGDGLDRIYLVTQLFTRVSEPLPADAVQRLLAGINQARAAHGGKPLGEERELRELAQHAAEQYFREPARTDEQIMSELRGALAHTPAKRPRKLGALLAVAGGLDDISGLAAVLDPTVQAISIGLAQGSRPDGFPNAICAVLLLSQ
jgi:uncharacterized protein YkwD